MFFLLGCLQTPPVGCFDPDGLSLYLNLSGNYQEISCSVLGASQWECGSFLVNASAGEYLVYNLTPSGEVDDSFYLPSCRGEEVPEECQKPWCKGVFFGGSRLASLLPLNPYQFLFSEDEDIGRGLEKGRAYVLPLEESVVRRVREAGARIGTVRLAMGRSFSEFEEAMFYFPQSDSFWTGFAPLPGGSDRFTAYFDARGRTFSPDPLTSVKESGFYPTTSGYFLFSRKPMLLLNSLNGQCAAYQFLPFSFDDLLVAFGMDYHLLQGGGASSNPKDFFPLGWIIGQSSHPFLYDSDDQNVARAWVVGSSLSDPGGDWEGEDSILFRGLEGPSVYTLDVDREHPIRYINRAYILRKLLEETGYGSRQVFECSSDMECLSGKCSFSPYWRAICRSVKGGNVSCDCRPGLSGRFVCRYVPLASLSQGPPPSRMEFPWVMAFYNRVKADDWSVLGVSTSEEFPLVRLSKSEADDIVDWGGWLDKEYVWMMPISPYADSAPPLFALCNATEKAFLRFVEIFDEDGENDIAILDYDDDAWNDWEEKDWEDLPVKAWVSGYSRAKKKVNELAQNPAPLSSYLPVFTTGGVMDRASSTSIKGYPYWVAWKTDSPDLLGDCNISSAVKLGVCEPRTFLGIARQDVILQDDSNPPCYWVETDPFPLLWSDPEEYDALLGSKIWTWIWSLGREGRTASETAYLKPVLPFTEKQVGMREVETSFGPMLFPETVRICGEQVLSGFSSEPGLSYLQERARTYLRANVWPIIVVGELPGSSDAFSTFLKAFEMGPVIVAVDFRKARESSFDVWQVFRERTEYGSSVVPGIYAFVSSAEDFQELRDYLETSPTAAQVIVLDLDFQGNQSLVEVVGDVPSEEEAYAEAMWKTAANFSRTLALLTTAPSIVYFRMPVSARVDGGWALLEVEEEISPGTYHALIRDNVGHRGGIFQRCYPSPSYYNVTICEGGGRKLARISYSCGGTAWHACYDLVAKDWTTAEECGDCLSAFGPSANWTVRINALADDGIRSEGDPNKPVGCLPLGNDTSALQETLSHQLLSEYFDLVVLDPWVNSYGGSKLFDCGILCDDWVDAPVFWYYARPVRLVGKRENGFEYRVERVELFSFGDPSGLTGRYSPISISLYLHSFREDRYLGWFFDTTRATDQGGIYPLFFTSLSGPCEGDRFHESSYSGNIGAGPEDQAVRVPIWSTGWCPDCSHCGVTDSFIFYPRQRENVLLPFVLYPRLPSEENLPQRSLLLTIAALSPGKAFENRNNHFTGICDYFRYRVVLNVSYGRYRSDHFNFTSLIQNFTAVYLAKAPLLTDAGIVSFGISNFYEAKDTLSPEDFSALQRSLEVLAGASSLYFSPVLIDDTSGLQNCADLSAVSCEEIDLFGHSITYDFFPSEDNPLLPKHIAGLNATGNTCYKEFPDANLTYVGVPFWSSSLPQMIYSVGDRGCNSRELQLCAGPIQEINFTGFSTQISEIRCYPG